MHTWPRAWSPAPLGSSTIEKHYGPIQHKYWCVKSAKLPGESWSPGLWSLSPGIRHFHHWCRDSCAQSNTFFSPMSYLKAERMAQQRKVFYTVRELRPFTLQGRWAAVRLCAFLPHVFPITFNQTKCYHEPV